MAGRRRSRAKGQVRAHLVCGSPAQLHTEPCPAPDLLVNGFALACVMQAPYANDPVRAGCFRPLLRNTAAGADFTYRCCGLGAHQKTDTQHEARANPITRERQIFVLCTGLVASQTLSCGGEVELSLRRLPGPSGQIKDRYT